jgi:type I restriction enzyme S subunit
MTAARKPYRTYKDSGISWLGEVPAHWTSRPGFSQLVEKAVKNTGMVEERVLSLSYGRIVVKPADKLHGLVPESFETYQIVDPGDIIIRSTDLQNDWTSLRVGIVRDRGIITSAYLCLKAKGELLPEYAFELLHAFDVMKVFYGLGSGLRQNLSFADFKRLPVFVPPEQEQTAIVKYLEHVDRHIRRYIRAKQRLIKILEEQKRALTSSVVLHGVDANSETVPTRNARSSSAPGHWSRLRLKDVAWIQTGLTLGKNYSGKELRSYPYLRVANVQTGRLDLRVVKVVEVPPEEADRCRLEEGDVLMTEGGDIDKLGRGCIWRSEVDNCLHQNHIFAVRCRPELDPNYLVTLMGSTHGRAYFEITAKQTTNLASTNSTTLRAFPIALPPIDEQLRILGHLERELAPTDAAFEQARREIDLLREYHLRLIADVVTGKLDVREAAASLPDEESQEDALLNEVEDVAEDGLEEDGPGLEASLAEVEA